MLKKYKGSGILILSLMAAMISSLIAVGISKSTSVSMNSFKSTETSIQAHNYAESKMKYLIFRGYGNLAEQARTTIAGTSFQDNVVLGTIADEGNGLSSRQVTVNVFKSGEAGSRATISRKFYSNDANMYVLNENSPTNSLSLKYANSRFSVKVDGDNEQKLLSNMTVPYSGNLNNLVETGFFNGTNLGNAPDNSWYYIENIRHSNMSNYYIDQKATNFGNGKIYHRQCRNGTWSSWQEVGGGGLNVGPVVSKGSNLSSFVMPYSGFVYGNFQVADSWEFRVLIDGNVALHHKHQNHTHYSGSYPRDTFTVFAPKGSTVSFSHSSNNIWIQQVF